MKIVFFFKLFFGKYPPTPSVACSHCSFVHTVALLRDLLILPPSKPGVWLDAWGCQLPSDDFCVWVGSLKGHLHDVCEEFTSHIRKGATLTHCTSTWYTAALV